METDSPAHSHQVSTIQQVVMGAKMLSSAILEFLTCMVFKGVHI